MYRNTDLDYVSLHRQDIYAEAERNRLIKASGILQERRQNSWWMKSLRVIPVWLARWSCAIQATLVQGRLSVFYPTASRLPIFSDPCVCAAEPCAD
jgi:hypothetical protein